MLNPREFDILNILWSADREMTSTDIADEMDGLTQSTVLAVLRRLLKGGFVDIVGVTHSGKVLSRTYRPTEKSKEILLDSFLELYSSFANIVEPELIASKILELKKKN